MHAQYRADLHARAFQRRERFGTYGNLWGAPTRYGFGLIYGAAAAQLNDDIASSKIDYVFYSYATPIAWHIGGLGWRIDCYRYGAASDKALGFVREAIRKLQAVDPYNEPVTLLRYRHGLSGRQLELLNDCINERRGVTVAGQRQRTLGVLLRKDLVVNGPFDTYTATPLGRAFFDGTGVTEAWPGGPLSVALEPVAR